MFNGNNVVIAVEIIYLSRRKTDSAKGNECGSFRFLRLNLMVSELTGGILGVM